MSENIYTWDEVAKHKSKATGVWVVIHNEVYDITKFMDDHPGGEEVLLEQAGGDSTESFDDIGHSPDAKELQKEYKIGKIADPKGYVPRENTSGAPADEQQGFSCDLILKAAIIIVLLLIVYSMVSPYFSSK